MTNNNTNSFVGLLGGSFNPAHKGHVQISELALDLLGLDEIWWIVSPKNPLKSSTELAPFSERFFQSEKLVESNPKIRVSDIEKKLGTVFTTKTISALTSKHKSSRFIWIMGADNLDELHRWKNWEKLFNQVAVAVFDRPTYSFRSLKSPAAMKYSSSRVSIEYAQSLKSMPPPAWIFLWSSFDSSSSRLIRESTLEKK